MTLRTAFRTTLALSLTAALALSASACLDEDAPADGDETAALEIAGFALTGDDSSDDGFTEDADPEPLIDELDDEDLGDMFDDGDEAPADDEVDPDPIAESPDRVARTVLVLWGQPRFDADFGEPSTWTGKIGSDVAHVRVLRKIRFERDDRLVRDGDPQTVSFDTTTGPHHDGLLLRIVAPRTAETLAGHLAFRTGKFQKLIPLADVLDGFQETYRVDEAGNALIVSTVAEHRCPHGVLRMRWHRKSARGGVFGGKYYGDDGSVSGYVVGLWGRVDGKPRFKGFFLDADRRFAGTLRGAYRPFPGAHGDDGGVFAGLWRHANGEVRGALGGVYRVGALPGRGAAFGFWRAACGDGGPGACEDVPTPGPVDCSCEPDADNGGAETCGCVSDSDSACVPAQTE